VEREGSRGRGEGGVREGGREGGEGKGGGEGGEEGRETDTRDGGAHTHRHTYLDYILRRECSTRIQFSM
jgi:hypothetical protein